MDQELLQVMREATHADRATLMHYDAEQRLLRIAIALGIPETSPHPIALCTSIAERVIQHRRPIVLPRDTDLPDHLVTEMQHQGLRSLLCVPMVVGQHVHGVISLARLESAQSDFTQEDLWFVSLLAERHAAALQTAHLYDELSTRERLLKTERQHLEAQLTQSAKMASLGVMAGGIAHEIRNPLAIITASAQLIEDHPDDLELHQQCVQKIMTSAQRASLIIEQLLKFSHPAQERFRLLNVHTTLEETFNLLDHQMFVSLVTLQRDFSPDMPRLYGNPELLQQVFTNLILNACNAMPHGGQLTVSTRIDGDYVELRFTDTGHGISTEHLSKIFDPFFTTRSVGKGTGLGLSISYSIIQQHQGTIEVVSEPGQGATFIIRLPVSD